MYNSIVIMVKMIFSKICINDKNSFLCVLFSVFCVLFLVFCVLFLVFCVVFICELLVFGVVFFFWMDFDGLRFRVDFFGLVVGDLDNLRVLSDLGDLFFF